MRLRSMIGIAGLCFVAAVSMGIKCSGEKQSDNSKATDFCLAANDVSGWTLWGNECTAWQASELQSTNELSGGVDGGADFWINRGMLEYEYQELTNNGKMIKAYVMDYQNTTNVSGVFTAESDQSAGSAVAIILPNYSNTVARMYQFGGGSAYELYAMLDRFYVKVVLLDMADQTEAQSMAEFLLDIYANKMQ